MTVAELLEQLQKLPQHLVVDAEGCDCVNEVRGAGNFEVDDGRGPRCILVCGPDFYGILGPTPKERRRMQRRAEERARRDQEEGG